MLMVQKKSGLWSDILLSKETDKNNSCFIRRKDIHFMHIAIIPIVKAFEELQSKFLEDKGNTARMHTPVDQLDLIVQRPATRSRKAELAKPMRTTHPYSKKERSAK